MTRQRKPADPWAQPRPPVKPMTTTSRQVIYAGYGRNTLTPAQRRRLRHKQRKALSDR